MHSNDRSMGMHAMGFQFYSNCEAHNAYPRLSMLTNAQYKYTIQVSAMESSVDSITIIRCSSILLLYVHNSPGVEVVGTDIYTECRDKVQSQLSHNNKSTAK